jgi:WD40 repeat protein
VHESKRHLRPLSVHLLVAALLALSACEKNPFEQVDPPGRANVAAGQAQGVVGESLSFGCIARDPSRLDLTYAFDWGDTDGPINPSEPTGGWTEPLADGQMGEQEHVFEKPGSYAVRCVARNTGDVVGDWSEPFTVTLSPRPRFTLTTSVEGEGTVRSSPEGIDCGTRCEAVFEAGTPLTLTATPAPGWSLVGWTGKCEGAEPRISLVLSAEASCTARFARDPLSYTFRMTLEGEGRVTSTPAGLSCTSDCTETLTGGTVSLKAEAAEGWRFERWGGACTGTAETTQVTLDVPLECTARFVPTVRFEQGWRRMGTSGPVSTVWSPDGTRIAAALGDVGTVALWDASTGALQRVLPAHPEAVLSVAWSPDGTQLATGDGGGTIRFWNSNTGELVRTFQALSRSGARSLAWSPDGKTLLSGLSLGMRVYDLATGDWVTLSSTDPIDRLAWCPDGLRFSAESWWSDAYWSTTAIYTSRRELAQTMVGQGLAWSPNSDAYTIGSGSRINVNATGTNVYLRVLGRGDEFLNGIFATAWSADGRYVAASDLGRLAVLDATTDKTVGGPLTTVRSRDLSFHPTRPTLLTSDPESGTISLYGAEGLVLERTLAPYQPRPEAVAWSPDGTKLATASGDGRLWLWSETGQWLSTLSEGGVKLTSVAWEPTGRWLVAGAEDGTVRRWRIDTGEEVLPAWRLTSRVNRVAWGPDGLFVAAGDEQGRVTVWNSLTGAVLTSFAAHQGAARALAWNPDGLHLLTGGDDKRAFIWNVKTSARTWTIPQAQAEAVGAVAWSPDGSMLATSGAPEAGAENLRLWNATTGEPLGFLPGRAAALTSLAWNPESNLLAGTRQDGALEVWDTRSRTRVSSQATAHQDAALDVSWAPLADSLSTCGADTALVTWRVMR